MSVTMTKAELVAFMRRAEFWVEATTHADGAPQAAVIGVAVSDDLELVFDTLGATRKAANLDRDPRMALVMWAKSDSGGQATVQVEGPADEPTGAALAAIKRVYFARFTDGPTREAWDGIRYVRVRPRWLRYTDFGPTGVTTVELDHDALARLV